LHKLRHFNATELIAAGVNIRTVAGRLGHAGGGTTTLRIYSAWFEESDQRAATALSPRMPARPADQRDPVQRAAIAPHAPFEKIAVDLRGLVQDGTLSQGSVLPTIKDLAGRYGVSVGTAYRATALLAAWGLVDISRGKRGVITAAPIPPLGTTEAGEALDLNPEPAADPRESVGRRRLLDLVVKRKGHVVAEFSAEADPDNADHLHQLLFDAVRRDGGDESQLSDFAMEVSDAEAKARLRTFVASSR